MIPAKRAIQNLRPLRLLLPLLILGVLVLGRDASPALSLGTETRLVVLLAEGWTSSSRDNATPGAQDPFLEIEFAVGDIRAQQGLSRENIVTERFSYNYPDPSYSGCATNQSLEDSAAALNHQLRELASEYPNARFVLVGHSLGGAIESYWAGTSAEQSMLERIDALITLDSPVSGLDIANWTGFLADFRATFECTGLNEFVDELKTSPRSQAIEHMHAASHRLGADRVFHWGSCLDLFVPCVGLSGFGSLGPDPRRNSPGRFAGATCVVDSALSSLVGPFVTTVDLTATLITCVGRNHSAILTDPEVLGDFKSVVVASLNGGQPSTQGSSQTGQSGASVTNDFLDVAVSAVAAQIRGDDGTLLEFVRPDARDSFQLADYDMAGCEARKDATDGFNNGGQATVFVTFNGCGRAGLTSPQGLCCYTFQVCTVTLVLLDGAWYIDRGGLVCN